MIPGLFDNIFKRNLDIYGIYLKYFKSLLIPFKIFPDNFIFNRLRNSE